MSLQMVARYDPMDIKDINEMMIDDCSTFFLFWWQFQFIPIAFLKRYVDISIHFYRPIGKGAGAGGWTS